MLRDSKEMRGDEPAGTVMNDTSFGSNRGKGVKVNFQVDPSGNRFIVQKRKLTWDISNVEWRVRGELEVVEAWVSIHIGEGGSGSIH